MIESHDRTMPMLFQHYFDTVLVKELDPRIMCCRRLGQLSLGDVEIGRSLAGIAEEFFQCRPAQSAALAGWPAPQLRIFASALGEAIGCPKGPKPPIPGPDPGPIFNTRFRGEVQPGVPPTIRVLMAGRDELEITFIAPEIP